MYHPLTPVALLFCSNLFMTFAWYGHLRGQANKTLLWAIFTSWGIAFFEYVLQVPANRIGSKYYDLGQLKVMQELITMSIFPFFAYYYLGQAVKLDYLWASLCLLGAAYFMFR